MSKKKHDLKAVIRKLLAAFLLVGIAIFLAISIARFSFRELLGTVDKLSEPNEKLSMLNSLFEEITTLDQLQRADAIKNPHKPQSTFREESFTLNGMIDSLKTFKWEQSQLEQIDKMKNILEERNKFFFDYLNVKSELLDNREFSGQLDTLAVILKKDDLKIDSTLVTMKKKTTTTYVTDTVPLKKSEKRSLIKKLFTKKKTVKQPLDTPRIRVQEEVSMGRVADTIAIAKQTAAVAEIEKIMREMENDQRNQRRKLQRQELELIHSNSLFINQLLNILHDVENEELQQMHSTNTHAVNVMTQSMERINMLMLGCFVAAAILVYLIWIDIGKSNYYKEELEKAKDEAEELTKIKQRFLANMSHEIRTPLQSIIGFAEQLKQKTSDKQEEVEAIHSSSEHLLQIVNEVLDYSRISSGAFVLANEKFRLMSVIKEVESAMRIQADHKNLTFILDCENSSEYSLTGDPFRLRQILYNIIGNAIKFTHKGYIRLIVKTIDEDKQVRCTFEVIDTGIGMDQEELSKIFNQFEQANSAITKYYGGTGLGLTIVKSLIDAQDGLLEVTSEKGAGSSFRIELKFDKAPASVINKFQYAKKLPVSAFKGKVLVVDDDTLILKLCSLILKKNNITFTATTNAKSLLHEKADPQINYIFLDIRMPEINGADLCKALRKKYDPSTKFIALTAHVLPEEKEDLIREGFDMVLPKPFHEQDLLSILGFTSSSETDLADEQPNLSTLRKMTMGDESLFQSILTQFIEETMEDIVLAKEFIRSENPKALREVVHKMAGRFAQLGMISLAGKIHTIEKQLVAGVRVSELAEDAARVLKKINDITIQIRLTTLENIS